jgi:archaemetzincin
LSRNILIRPIGFVEEDTLENIAGCIETRCGLDCVISSPMESPRYAYDERRCQYDSKLILKNMITCCPQDALGFMGVTHADLFVPILKYVYGLSQVEGRCSLISTHRLDPRFYDNAPDPALLMARLEKTALHELGHSFGLTHCRNRHCVMYSSTRIEHTDFKQSDLCPTCLELLRWHIKKM